MTPKELDELINKYAWRCVENMKIKDIHAELVRLIAYEFVEESDEYVIEVIRDNYPDLFEE